MKIFERHPISAMFRDLTEQQSKDLRASIEKNGQQIHGTIYEGKILDGWQRYLATKELGKTFLYNAFKGNHAEAVVKVICLNLQRRHMNDEERRILGTKLISLIKHKPIGHNQSTPISMLNGTNKENHSHKIISKALNISSASLSRAAYVKKHDPNSFKECENGNLSTNKAYIQCKRSENGFIHEGDKIKFPDCYSHYIEIETFMKIMSKKGWGCNITSANGMFEAKFIRSWVQTTGEHSISRAIITALHQVRKSMELDLLNQTKEGIIQNA